MAHSVPVQPGDVVRVNVRFSSHAPLADTRERALAEARQAGTRLLYRLAGGECAILRETIAATCRLTALNVSAQVREPGKRAPLRLYLNGNAQYAITLQEERAN